MFFIIMNNFRLMTTILKIWVLKVTPPGKKKILIVFALACGVFYFSSIWNIHAMDEESVANEIRAHFDKTKTADSLVIISSNKSTMNLGCTSDNILTLKFWLDDLEVRKGMCKADELKIDYICWSKIELSLDGVEFRDLKWRVTGLEAEPGKLIFIVNPEFDTQLIAVYLKRAITMKLSYEITSEVKGHIYFDLSSSPSVIENLKPCIKGGLDRDL